MSPDLNSTVRDIVEGRLNAAVVNGSQRLLTSQKPRIVIPGSFNPLHRAHRRIADLATELLNGHIAFELSVVNVDKPPLEVAEVLVRLRQFEKSDRIWITRESRFLGKAKLFPGATFVVGADTIKRIGDPSYYTNPSEQRTAIARIVDRGCRFLVFGRKLDEGFATLLNLPLPPELRRICTGVDESRFRCDISSSELRRH